MKNSLKKRGQKFIRKFSRASIKASEESKERIKENLVERISHIQNIRLLIFEWGLMAAALIMLAVAQAFWFSQSYASDVFVSGGTYVEATLGRVNSLNPLFATTSSEKTLSRLLFATLTSVDYSGHAGLGLADYVRSSEDGQIWTVRLRDSLQWSDGQPLTNEDVLFTVGLIQNPAVSSIYNANLENVEVRETEGGEIVFRLPNAYADFISALEIPIVPKHILSDVPARTLIEADFSNNPVSSGAFKFNASQSGVGEERTVYLSANEYYYMGAPKLSSFAVHTYNTKEEIISAVNLGSVTATAELSGKEADSATSSNFNKKDSSISAGVFMFFNLNNSQLAKRDLRTAIRQGLNLSEIRTLAPGTRALNYPILSSQIELNNYPDLPEYNFDIAKLKIAEVLGGAPLNLRIATVDSGYLPTVTEALAEQLRTLGIECTVTAYAETQDFVTGVITKRNYDILVYEVELGADPDPLPYYHSSQTTAAGLNLSGYRNALVDDLLIGARETTDAELRARKYESFLGYWVADAPAVGLYQPNLTYIYNKNVRPYSNDVRLSTALDRFSDITDWAAVKGLKNLTP